MKTEPELLTPEAFAPGGPSTALGDRLGLSSPAPLRRMLKIGLVILITWVPLLGLSWRAGHAWGDQVQYPFLRDLDAYVRFLFALPLLELGTILAATLLPRQLGRFRELGLIPPHESMRFSAAQAEMLALRNSALADGGKLLLAIGFPLATRVGLGFSVGDSSWERLDSTITPAGWWYVLVSLPLLFFLLVRRIWGFLLWSWFLFRVSRLDLQLSATHPDRAGGLGFIARGQVAYGLLLMACAGMVSAGFGEEILNRGKSLDDLKYHVGLFVILALFVLHLPLLAFSGRMIRCRQRGLLDFAALVLRYDRAFEERWIENVTQADRESILGHPDFQALGGVATAYDHVNEMRPFPFDTRAFVVLALAAAAPMIPLLGAAIPFREILLKLGEMMI